MVQRIMVKVWTVQCNGAVGNQNGEEASPGMNEESIAAKSADCCEHTKTHDEITLLYMTCNPDTLVANGIKLCTPSSENKERNKGHRGWRNMSSVSLARQRTKSMPRSEFFVPKRAMAVDLFPHTSHFEMVMLFEQ